MEVIPYIIRCIIMFIVTWTGIRFMGKKSISNMTSYDLAAIMLITTIAAEPLVFKITTTAVAGVTVITIISMIIGYISLKEFFYKIDASPVILVANGKIIKNALRKVHMNIPLLLSELRIQGYLNLSDVQYAILEVNGRISTIPVSQRRPVQTSDLNIKTDSVNISLPIIYDGVLNENNLKYAKKEEKWLIGQLKKNGIKNIEDVLFAQLDSSGNLYINLNNNDITLPDI